jgi:hypothetical protein
MGVIFQKEIPVEPLTNVIADTITDHLQSALAETAPAEPEAMRERARMLAQPVAEAAAQAAARAPAKMTINWKPFFISLGIFFVLLVIAIFLDWRNIVDDPKVYTGMVTTVLGAVLGFLGGEATGTVSS